jgi:hypothetical protein
MTNPVARAARPAGLPRSATTMAALTLACAVAPPPIAPPAPPPPVHVAPDALADAEERARLDRVLEIGSAIENEQESFVLQVLQDRLISDFGPVAAFDYGLRQFRDPMRASFGAGGDDGGDLIDRVHSPRGARDATACDGCHSVGGRDGAGSATQVSLSRGDGVHLSSARPRNAPPLQGVGVVQQLAVEMTADLQAIRARALAEGRLLRLVSKGVDFGTIAPGRDGGVDLSDVRGVDPDLVVRPFGWTGDHATLRGFLVEALQLHFGLQTATAERDDGLTATTDPDGDGVLREVEEGSVTALELYLSLLELPVIAPPADPALAAAWSRGAARFPGFGCAACHLPTLSLDQRVVTLGPPPGFTVNLLADGERPKGTDQVALYADLKRHDLDLPERGEATAWLTRPLWGLADSGPYLHDGRAATLDEAIDAHGGEAAPARATWRAATDADRADLRVWLTSLTRAPRLRPR